MFVLCRAAAAADVAGHRRLLAVFFWRLLITHKESFIERATAQLILVVVGFIPLGSLVGVGWRRHRQHHQQFS